MRLCFWAVKVITVDNIFQNSSEIDSVSVSILLLTLKKKLAAMN